MGSPNEEKFWLRNYINGKWLPSLGGKDFTLYEAKNPTKAIDTFPDSNQADAEKAVEAAQNAWCIWRHKSWEHRIEILINAGKLIVGKADELSGFMAKEIGQEPNRMKNQILLLLSRVPPYDILSSQDEERFRNTFRYIVGCAPRPVGVTAIIGFPRTTDYSYWNFYFSVAKELYSGNTIVFKPRKNTSASATFITQIFLEAGLDECPGVFNLLHSSNDKLDSFLALHPQVSEVSLFKG